MERKLSDILIEIAMQGLKSPKYAHDEVMHPLMLLAHIAWNRDTMSPDYPPDGYQQRLAEFGIPKSKIRRKLISEDWEEILERMLAYKQARFPEDSRVITLCAYTPWGTLRVEWE
jgi:hypothetical protein